MTSTPEDTLATAAELQQILIRRFPDQVTLYADLFAMACLLHFQGERCVAHTLIRQVLQTVGQAPETRRLDALLDRLTGNEMRFAHDMQPSPAIRELWQRAVRGPVREAACAR